MSRIRHGGPSLLKFIPTRQNIRLILGLLEATITPRSSCCVQPDITSSRRESL